MRPVVLFCAALLVTGCGGALRSGTFNLQDAGHVLPPLGINDGFHAGLDPSTVAQYCGHTIRTPQLSADALQVYYASIASCPSMHTIVLVEGPDVALVAALAPLLHPGDRIEAGNELELQPHELTVAQYGAWIAQARAAAVVPIITGGVFTLNADTKPYLLAAKAACPDCILGIHLYEDVSDADLAWLTALGRPLAVTEFGSPTRCKANGDVDQKAWIDNQWATFAHVPAIMDAIVYQRAIGPSCSALDTFGLGPLAQELFR